MNFQTTDALNGSVAVVQIPKQLSAEISDEFKDFLYDLVEKGKYKIVVDLSATEYVDSSGLGAIVSRIATCRSKGGDIRLAAPSDFMESLLNITHLDQVLDTFKDVESAVQSFN